MAQLPVFLTATHAWLPGGGTQKTQPGCPAGRGHCRSKSLKSGRTLGPQHTLPSPSNSRATVTCQSLAYCPQVGRKPLHYRSEEGLFMGVPSARSGLPVTEAHRGSPKSGPRDSFQNCCPSVQKSAFEKKYFLLKECCCKTRSLLTLKFCYELSRGSWPRHLPQADFQTNCQPPGFMLPGSGPELSLSVGFQMQSARLLGCNRAPSPRDRPGPPRSTPVPQKAPVGSGDARLTPAAWVSVESEVSVWPTSCEPCHAHVPSTDAQMAPQCPPATLGPDAPAEQLGREDDGCQGTDALVSCFNNF